MKAKIVTVGELFIVGIGVNSKARAVSSIGPLWDVFLPRVSEISGSHEIFGVCSYLNAEGDFSYIVGCKVDESAEVPWGMEMWKVVSHRYLVSGFSGLPREMGKQWQATVEKLLPEAGVEARPDGPWLESYTDGYSDLATGNVSCDLYTPIEG